VLIDAVGQQLLINYFFGMRFAVNKITAESFFKGQSNEAYENRSR
jgi:hypothetical protein